MNKRAKQLIELYHLLEHPEGGYYFETDRSKEQILKDALPERYSGNRDFFSHVYFLLAGNQFSAFHKLKSDEFWHFYEGSSITIHTIDDSGKLEKLLLGNNSEKGEQYQQLVKKESWFCACINEQDSYTFFGCTVVPGFDYDDFELGSKEKLSELYPEHKELFSKFCIR